jgi:hypothetical protein
MSITVGNFTYTISGSTASITGYDGFVFNNLTIPSTINYDDANYSVTSIGDDAFFYCFGITSLTIPGSVTSIGFFAFNGCSGITSLTIPDSVTSIGNAAFQGCTGLTSLTIPNQITSINNYTFYGCTGLKSITISTGVTSIGIDAFRDCNNVTYVSIPTTVTSIGVTTFYGCTSLQSITIPNSVQTIDNGAFQGCTGLTSFTIPNQITSINDYTFYGCTSLQSISIPVGITSIGYVAFQYCTGLQSITIPVGITSIGASAFQGCNNITSMIFDNQAINQIISAGSLGGSTTTVFVLNYPNTYLQNYTYPSGNIIYNFGTGSFNYSGANLDGNSIVFNNLNNSTTYAITYDTANTFNSGNQQTIIVNGATTYTVSDLLPQTYSYKIGYGTDESTYSGVINQSIPCFMKGTKILCQINGLDKYIPVESITNDMLVKTYKHGYKKVIRIGHRGISCNYSKDTNNLYKLPKNDDVFEDLYITGGHSCLVDELDDFQKKETLKIWNKLEKIDNKFLLLTVLNKSFIKHEITEPVNVYHVVLENDDINGAYGIYSNGLLTETMSQKFFDDHTILITVD